MLPEDVWGNAWKQFRQMGITYNHSNESLRGNDNN